MVVPIRDIEIKFFLSLANMILPHNMTLLTISLLANMEIDLSFRNISDNYNKMRGRTTSPNLQSSRTFPISSSKSSVAYHVKMENNNDLEDNINI